MTLGDLLVVVAQMLIGMYAFELIYRVRLSPVAVMHHIGTIVIGQVAIAISLRLDREPDADYEFVLCTVWGGLEHTISYHHPIYKLVRVVLSSFVIHLTNCLGDIVRSLRHHLRILPPHRYHPLPHLPTTSLLPQPGLPLLLHHHGDRDDRRDHRDHVPIRQSVAALGNSVQGDDADAASGLLGRAGAWESGVLENV